MLITFAGSSSRWREGRLCLGAEPGVHPQNERAGCPAGGALPRQQVEESSITLICRPAAEAGVQVLANGLGLFRTKLLIQIFPQPDQDFVTFHPSNPR
jgi:hypothetical protein